MLFKRCKKYFDGGGGRPLGKPSRGAILIEFAFAVPIMIMLLYYIHDLVKISRIKRQMQFCGEIMVNILQNISQNRDNKAITRADFARSVYAAFLTYYGSDLRAYSEEGDASRMYYRYFPHPMMFCVKGLDDGKATILWCMHPAYYKPPNNFATPYVRTGNDNNMKRFSLVKPALNTPTAPENIAKNLVIKPGEIKLIIDVAFYTEYTSIEQASQRFGCYIYKPKPVSEKTFFNTLIIFSPRPGLFSETDPK